MKRAFGTVLFVVYSIIAITVTVLLLSFNEYNCSEIGDYTVYIVNDDALEPEYKQGSILLIKNTNDKHVQAGDELFLYKVINSQEYEMVVRTLESKSQQGRHLLYAVSEGESFAADYFVGKAEDTIVIEGWGIVLSILESKWGYLFCIVIISLLLFLQEVFELIIEIKYGSSANTTKKSTTKKASSSATTTKKRTTATVTKANDVAKKVATATKTVSATVKANNSEIQTGEKEEG